MKKLSLACLLMLIGSSVATAQSSIHRCEVSLTDFNTDTGSEIGNFTTVIESEKPVTKAYPFPGTKLFVTASVLYMQASPYTEGSPPAEMILTLFLGRKAYSNIEAEMRNSEVLSNARAVISLKSFEQARVETIYLGQRQPIIITLECKK